MAGAGYKLFVTGDVLTAAQVNTYLQEQTVMRFASAAARTSALTAVLAEGMMSYLVDTNAVEVYDGASWVSVGSTGDITGVTAGTGISGGGTSGDVTVTNSMATAIDAKGDLIVGTGADAFSRLAVGATNGQVLTVDSAEATGLKYATVAAGYTLISTTTITATSTTTISVSANSYSQLVIILDNMFLGTNGEEINIRFNGDTGSNYKFFRVGTSGTTSDVNANATSSDINGFFGATGTASSKGCGFLQINKPNGTDKFTFGGNSFTVNNAGTISSRYVGGFYDGAAVISSISVIGSNSATATGTVTLYGI